MKSQDFQLSKPTQDALNGLLLTVAATKIAGIAFIPAQVIWEFTKMTTSLLSNVTQFIGEYFTQEASYYLAKYDPPKLNASYWNESVLPKNEDGSIKTVEQASTSVCYYSWDLPGWFSYDVVDTARVEKHEAIMKSLFGNQINTFTNKVYTTADAVVSHTVDKTEIQKQAHIILLQMEYQESEEYVKDLEEVNSGQALELIRYHSHNITSGIFHNISSVLGTISKLGTKESYETASIIAQETNSTIEANQTEHSNPFQNVLIIPASNPECEASMAA